MFLIHSSLPATLHIFTGIKLMARLSRDNSPLDFKFGLTMREIPQDIYYEILYSRLLDCGDLKACSLVCRAWLSVTRGLLFRAIRLSEEQAFRDFKKALTRTEAMRSSVSHCVRKVTISDLGLNMDGLSRDAVASSLVMHQLLSMLPSLRTLRLERVEWDHTDPSLPVCFENIPITSLLFARTRFPSPGHLLQLVANLPCLSSLSISFIEWGTVDLEDSDLLSNHNLTHPIHIQSLKVYKCSNARGLLRGLLAPPSELRLARLEWTWSDSDDLPDDQYQRQEDDQYQREEDEAPLLSTLLQASSTTLAELRLSIVWDDSCKRINFTWLQNTHTKSKLCLVSTSAQLRSYSKRHTSEDIGAQRVPADRLCHIRHVFELIAHLPQRKCACLIMLACTRDSSRYIRSLCHVLGYGLGSRRYRISDPPSELSCLGGHSSYHLRQLQ